MSGVEFVVDSIRFNLFAVHAKDQTVLSILIKKSHPTVIENNVLREENVEKLISVMMKSLLSVYFVKLV